MSASAAREKGVADISKPEMRVEIEREGAFVRLFGPQFNAASK